MRLTRRELLGVAAATAPLSGCTGGTGGSSSPTESESMETSSPTPSPTSTASPGPMTTTEGASAPTVQVSTHPELGEILAGPDGMTLYMFDSDTEGEAASVCSGSCAEAWPPLTVEGSTAAGDGVTASLETFEREGGESQVMAGGWPLYYFANDEEPGDANGQGAGGVWWVLRPDGTPVRPETTETEAGMSAPTVQVSTHPDLGDVLVGPDEMTLYMFDSDTEGEAASTCSGSCAESWPPLTVEGEAAAGDSVTAQLDTFEREGGESQVMAGGWSLYYFARDEEPGDANGQGVGDVWWVLRPDGTPVRPEATPTETETPGY